jgi:hypothetical protein
MYGNDRTFTFPSEGGVLATEGTVDKKLANLKTGGSKIYKHSFTYEGHNYEMLSLSSSSMTDINTFMDHIGNILSLACTSTNLMYAGTNIFSLSFSAIEWNPNTGIATTKEFYLSTISNYSCKEV